MDNRSNGKKKIDNWTKLAGLIFGLTAIVSLGLLGTIVSLNMLPIMYMVIIILAVLLFLVGTFWLLFLPQIGANDKKPVKKNTRFICRCIGLLMALTLVFVDAVGINMISQLQGAISDITGNDEEVVMEVVGVYVLAEDHATELKHVAGYDLGRSYSYDKESIETAVKMMEASLGDSLDWNDFVTVTEMIDALLAGEVDAVILHTSYLSILDGQEEYADIQSKIKLIHEFSMEDKDAVISNIATKPEDITKEPFIVYVSGNDTNYSLQNVRSDVNILAVVNPVTKQVLLINTPRDYYVELQGSGDGDGNMDKLTHCGIYGIECSMATLGDLYDQDIHYYAQVSFVGFTRLIDAMGGITVYSDASFYAAESGTRIRKGENYLDGREALGFVRERHNLPDGDNARGRHQMAVIQAIIKKATSGAMLTNYSDILESMGSCFGTNISNEEAANLVKMQLGDMASWNVKSFSVTGEGTSKGTYSIPGAKSYVVLQDEACIEHVKNLIDKVFDGEILTDEDLVLPAE